MPQVLKSVSFFLELSELKTRKRDEMHQCFPIFLFYNDSSVFNNRTYLKTLLEFACKKGQIDVVQQFNFSINLNAQHVIGMTQSINLNAQNVNGMTPFDLPVYALLDFEQTDIRNYFDF